VLLLQAQAQTILQLSLAWRCTFFSTWSGFLILGLWPLQNDTDHWDHVPALKNSGTKDISHCLLEDPNSGIFLLPVSTPTSFPNISAGQSRNICAQKDCGFVEPHLRSTGIYDHLYSKTDLSSFIGLLMYSDRNSLERSLCFSLGLWCSGYSVGTSGSSYMLSPLKWPPCPAFHLQH
jgi:hypothetical protein